MRPNRGGNLIIIVNDNEMSIAEDFGGMYGQLAKLRTSNGMAELNLFKHSAWTTAMWSRVMTLTRWWKY